MFFEGFLKLKDLLENVLHILAFGYIVYAHHYHDVARFGVVKVALKLSPHLQRCHQQWPPHRSSSWVETRCAPSTCTTCCMWWGFSSLTASPWSAPACKLCTKRRFCFPLVLFRWRIVGENTSHLKPCCNKCYSFDPSDDWDCQALDLGLHLNYKQICH